MNTQDNNIPADFLAELFIKINDKYPYVRTNLPKWDRAQNAIIELQRDVYFEAMKEAYLKAGEAWKRAWIASGYYKGGLESDDYYMAKKETLNDLFTK